MKKYSASLTLFRELIKEDNKRTMSRKREEERRNLLFWFVDNCPASDGPETAKKFNDFGIITNNHYKELKRRIIENTGLKKGDTYRYCENGTEMEGLIGTIETIYSSRRKAIIYFSKGKFGEMDSLYIRLRNSFAHGNYFKVKDYYYLWNETGSDGKTQRLGSFMMLKYEDLKGIYKAISSSE